MSKENKKKPVNTPKAWNFKKRFVDNEGNVFLKGVYSEEETLKEKSKTQSLTSERDEASKESFSKEENVYENLKKEYEEKNNQLAKALALIDEKMKALNEKTAGSAPFDAEAFARAFAKAQNEQKGGGAIYEAGEAPEDNIGEEEVLFTAYGFGTCFVDKRNSNGQVEMTPYSTKEVPNVLKFRPLISKSTGVGRDKQTSYVCGYKTRDLKIIDWFRTHPLFGILIFENNANAPLDKDIEFAKAIADEIKIVSSMDQNQLISNAKHYEIKLGGSMEDLKGKIAMARANRKLKDLKIKAEEAVRSLTERKIFN